MANAIVLNEFGSVDNLKYQKYDIDVLKVNEIRIKQTAIGVNFLDIYHRTGNHFNNISLGLIIFCTFSTLSTPKTSFLLISFRAINP